MGEANDNMKAVLHVNSPKTRFPVNGCLICQPIIRPGVQIILESKNHRLDADGNHEICNSKGVWIPLGAIQVWVIEDQGPPPADMWVYGVQVGAQMSEESRAGTRQVTAGTGQLLGFIEVAMVKEMERELLYGAGQGAGLGLVK